MSSTNPSIRVAVEVDSPGHPLLGRIIHPMGEERPFRGWLGLVAALERVLVDQGRPPRDGNGDTT